MSRDPETSAPSSPRISAPSRRTILTGAAWSVPVIAAASIAPIAAAASNVPVLAFNQTTYNGTACGTITGAYVTVTVGGVPTAAVSVTVTLSGGYTFAGGSATYTGVSDGSGNVALPAISVPAVGGTGALSAATAGGAAATSALSSPARGSVHRYVRNVNTGYAATQDLAFPSGSTPVGAIAFLSPAGDLYWGTDGKIATGVSKAVGGIDDRGQFSIEYTSSANGSLHRYVRNVNTGYAATQDLAFPSGSTPVGGIAFLSPAGDLYWGTDGKIATGVSKAAGGIDDRGQFSIDYTQATPC